VVAFSNVGEQLLPGMTANVRIVTDNRDSALKVPNAALRFSPMTSAGTSAQRSGLAIGPGGGSALGRGKSAVGPNFGRGSRQQVWIIGADGKTKSVPVVTGDTDGSMTEVSGEGIRPGMKVATGQLAAAAS